MPGSTPATSQLDWLISTTAMIVLSWSKATRDLLKSFGWGIRALHQLVAATNGAISSPPAPYHLSAGGRWIRTFGPPPPGARRQIPGLQAKTPSRRPCAQLGKSESGYQAPAAVRWVTVSRSGARKVW